jgi:hypothetical protein
MAKRIIKGKEIIDHLRAEGFKEIKEAEKLLPWYKKASEYAPCLKRKASGKKSSV